MKYAYLPGCSLHGTAVEYETSIKEIAPRLGVELVDIPDWNCCGASSAHSTDHFLATAIPARNVLQAEKTGCDVMTAPCPACYVRSLLAQKELRENTHAKAHFEAALGLKDFQSNIKIKNIIEVFQDTVQPEMIQKPLKGLKIANYYGCALVKPSYLFKDFDDAENPMSMDDMLTELGAECVPWPYKTECCGASLCFTNEEAVIKVLRDILQMAKDSGANCIVTACNLCQSNLDMRQSDVEKKYKTNYSLPILYFTQLIGLAIGVDPAKLSFNKMFVDPTPLFKSVNLL